MHTQTEILKINNIKALIYTITKCFFYVCQTY